MDERKPLKIMAISSGGGHWVQMRRIIPAFAGMDVVYVSVDPSSAADVPGQRYHAIRSVTRRDRLGFAVLIAQPRPPRSRAHDLDRLDRQRRAAVLFGSAGAPRRRRLADAVGASRPARGPAILGRGAVTAPAGPRMDAAPEGRG
jgi:hypothetical protein